MGQAFCLCHRLLLLLLLMYGAVGQRGVGEGSAAEGSETEGSGASGTGPEVDGGWSVWGQWSSCSLTCAGGKMTRTRTCTNPSPDNGGANCVGGDAQTKLCNPDPCPVPGGWSNWGAWAGCGVTCGGGVDQRTRTCTNPPPNFGGTKCTGNNVLTKVCNPAPCPIPGGWSNWGSWAGCEVTCGGGVDIRSRTCTKPPPNFGGAKCTGSNVLTKVCNPRPCPISGGWSNWGAWAGCGVTCGGGVDQRTRTCTNPPPNFGGAKCAGSNVLTKVCNPTPCPIPGGWSNWGSWAGCAVTCGGAVDIRPRTCTNPPPKFGGAICKGSNVLTKVCNPEPCPVPGGWSNWGAWAGCGVSCGGGVDQRFRSCTNPPPNFGGAKCIGNNVLTKPCNPIPCPIPGGWTNWGPWQGCGVTCGGGVDLRLRTCTNPPPNFGGPKCTGNNVLTKVCNPAPCPIPGGWSNWGSWAGCAVTCGGAVDIRPRTCTNPPPKFGGAICKGSNELTKVCNPEPCPVPGGWSNWGAWAGCGVSCGGGVDQRSRTCTNPPPKFGGAKCTGSNELTKVCNPTPCPIPGGWSNWGPWQGCGVTCGGGVDQRSRTCTNPPPNFGGAKCSGRNVLTKVCNPAPCPIPGGWSNWGAWAGCGVSCGGGVDQRSRTCTNPPPNFGGAKCSGSNVLTKVCNPAPCPIPGGWSNWGAWAGCGVSCGGGVDQRSRTCTNPPPKFGGAKCSGSNVLTKVCNAPSCPTSECEPHCPDMTVTCTTHSILVELVKASYPFLNPYDLHLLDNTCKANTVNSTHVVFKVPLDSCGTTHESKGKKIVYSNQITGKVSTKSLITREHNTDFKFKCKFDSSVILSVGGLTPDAKTVITIEDAAGDYNFVMDMYKTGKFQATYTDAEFPVSVDLGQRLFFQVEVKTKDTNLILYVDYCKATPGNDRNAKNYYSIIKDGCGKDATLQYKYNIKAMQQRFSFEAFRFVGESQDIFIHCSVQVCRKDNKKSRCLQGCDEERRLRRELENQDGEDSDMAKNKGAVTIGPLIFKEKDEAPTPQIDDTFVWVLAVCGVLGVATICGLVIGCRIRVYRKRQRKYSDRSSSSNEDTLSWISLDDITLKDSKFQLTQI